MHNRCLEANESHIHEGQGAPGGELALWEHWAT